MWGVNIYPEKESAHAAGKGLIQGHVALTQDPGAVMQGRRIQPASPHS